MKKEIIISETEIKNHPNLFELGEYVINKFNEQIKKNHESERKRTNSDNKR